MSTTFVSFTSSVPSILNGGNFVLSWNVTGAQSLALSSSDGLSVSGLALDTTLPVTPSAKDAAVLYTLTATDPAGIVTTDKLTVAVGTAAVPGPGGLRMQPLPGLTSPALSLNMSNFGNAIMPMPIDGYKESMTPAELDAFIKKSADKYTSNGTPLTPAQLALVQAREKAFEDAYHAGPAGAPVKQPVRQIFSATGLPPGMTMSEHGEMNGTPTVAGTFNVTVKVIDSLGNTVSTEVLPYTVNPSGGNLAISPTSLPTATQGIPHTVNFTTVTK